MVLKEKVLDGFRERFKKDLSEESENALTAIVEKWNKLGLIDLRWLAYILATIYHETAFTFLPIEEYGKGKGRPYGQVRPTGHVYYGRGLVQITWEENYSRFGRLLGIDLLHKPELALDMKISLDITFKGMIKGLFTGKKLSDYFNAEVTDWRKARKIINGSDKDAVIAGYAEKFYRILTT